MNVTLFVKSKQYIKFTLHTYRDETKYLYDGIGDDYVNYCNLQLLPSLNNYSYTEEIKNIDSHTFVFVIKHFFYKQSNTVLRIAYIFAGTKVFYIFNLCGIWCYIFSNNLVLVFNKMSYFLFNLYCR